jgi:endoglucanase
MKISFIKTKLVSMLGTTLSVLCMTYSHSNATAPMRTMTSMQIVQDMNVGWNLGNTLDAWGTNTTGVKTETYWGVPKTTKAMLDTVKAKGFKTIRLPVTWDHHFGEGPDFIIDPVWLDRVEEVVKYAMDGKTYLILNSHHDEWVTLTAGTKTEVKEKISKIWAQIANRFKDYDDYLIFETLNEPRLYGTPQEWTGGTVESRSILNEYNAAIVSSIRSTGGNNVLRHIMIPTYSATSLAEAQNALIIPASETRIIVSQHIYAPYSFSMDTASRTSTDKWGSAVEKNALNIEFDRAYNKFVKNGIPVVIGEWGTINKNNLDARVAHAEFFAKAARQRGMCPVWWDNNITTLGNAGYGLLDRNTNTWSNPAIAEAIVRSLESGISIFRPQIKTIGKNPVVNSTLYSGFLFNLQGRKISGNRKVDLKRKTRVRPTPKLLPSDGLAWTLRP